MHPKQLIVHIGAPKSGSTYLQQVLLQNTKLLEMMGVNYPCTDNGHPGTDADPSAFLAQDISDIFPNEAHTTILSHEDLLPRPAMSNVIRDAATRLGVSVHVVVFLRPFSEVIYGSYSQHMKQFFATYLDKRQAYDGQDFLTFAKARTATLKPEVWLRRWDSAFPQTDLVVRSYRDIQATFTDLLDLPSPLNWKVHKTLVNRSLRVCDCEQIAQALQDPSQTADQITEMHKQHFHMTSLTDTGRTPARTDMMEDWFSKTNQALLEQFGYDNIASQF